MITLTREEAQKVLDALETVTSGVPDTWHGVVKACEAIETLRARLSAPEPEPVAIVSGYFSGQCVIMPINPSQIFNSGTALYTAPLQQKEWQGLTDEEAYKLKIKGRDLEFVSMTGLRRFASDIETTLKGKNT